MRKWVLTAILTASITVTSFNSIFASAKQSIGGWKYNSNSGVWYQYDNGRIAYNTWIKKEDSGKWYYLNDRGFADSNGWKNIDNQYYLFNSAGELSSGWVQDTYGNWYYSYSDSSSSIVEGIQIIDGVKYSFNENGIMQTGWIQVQDGSGDYYLANKDGKVICNKWIKDTASGKTYYLLDDGKMARGSVEIQGKLRDFDITTGELINSSINN